MFRVFVIVLLAIVACVSSKPVILGAPLAYSAPLVASVPATAVVSREYHGNGFVSPYIAASPYVESPYVASSYVATPYTAAYSAPIIAAPSAYSGYSAPVVF